jgi:hypothetical protein
MLNPKLLRNLAMYGVSLPTLAAPAAAKATVYMPSHIATKMLGGRAEKRVVDEALDRGIEADPKANDVRAGTEHAA